MAAASLAALGAWEDTPRRNLEADVTRVGLSNREAFVLTRIDGFSTISEIFNVPENSTTINRAIVNETS